MFIRHSAIKYVTPDEKHSGRNIAILENRHKVYLEAKARNPNRWSGNTRDWRVVSEVVLNPNLAQK